MGGGIQQFLLKIKKIKKGCVQFYNLQYTYWSCIDMSGLFGSWETSPLVDICHLRSSVFQERFHPNLVQKNLLGCIILIIWAEVAQVMLVRLRFSYFAYDPNCLFFSILLYIFRMLVGETKKPKIHEKGFTFATKKRWESAIWSQL